MSQCYPKWSSEEVVTLKRLFSEHTNKELSCILNRSVRAVEYKAQELNLYKTHDHLSKVSKLSVGNGWSKEEERCFVKEYPTRTLSELKKMFPSRTYDSLRSKAREYGLLPTNETLRRALSKHVVEHGFFSALDSPNKAYLVGFIFADGNLRISKGNYALRISLHPKDLVLLEKIRDLLSPTVKIRKTSMGLVSLEITSKQLFLDLGEIGVYPNKTYLDVVPKIPPRLYCHYLRGLFDGDGTVWQASKTKQAMVSITNSVTICYDVLQQTRKFLSVGGSYEVRVGKTGHEHGRWTLGGINQIRSFASWVYSDLTSLYLERKYMRFREYGVI